MARLAGAALLARAVWATRQVPLPQASLAEVHPGFSADAVHVFDAMGVKAGTELGGEDRADADKEPIGNADDPAASGSDSGRSADVAKAGGGAGVKAAVAPAAHITDFSEEEATRFVTQLGGVGRLRDIMTRLGLEDGAASPPRTAPEAQPQDDEAEPAEKRRRRDEDLRDRREEGDAPSLASEPADGPAAVLGERIVDLASMLEERQKGDRAIDVFGHWSEGILNEPLLVPELIRWLESTSGTRFLLQALGKIRSVSKVKQQIKDAARMMGFPLEAIQAFSEAAPEMKETLLGMLKQWDMRTPQRADTEQPLDLTFAKNATERLRDIAQLQARILVKAGKFFVSCDLKEGKDAREMRFRATVSGGRRILEARYLGSADKFPNLEPWITFKNHPDEVIFIGLEGTRAVDAQSQFYRPLEATSLNVTLPGVSAFALDMFEGEPVVMIFDTLRTEAEGRTLWERCFGARTRRALSGFVAELKDTNPGGGTF